MPIQHTCPAAIGGISPSPLSPCEAIVLAQVLDQCPKLYCGLRPPAAADECEESSFLKLSSFQLRDCEDPTHRHIPQLKYHEMLSKYAYDKEPEHHAGSGASLAARKLKMHACAYPCTGNDIELVGDMRQIADGFLYTTCSSTSQEM